MITLLDYGAGNVRSVVNAIEHLGGTVRAAAGLIAPRPYVQVNGKDDGIFLIDGAKACFEQAQKCYAAAGAPEKCRLVIGDAGHRFYAAAAWPVLASDIFIMPHLHNSIFSQFHS